MRCAVGARLTVTGVAIELELLAPPREPKGLLDDLVVADFTGPVDHDFDPNLDGAAVALAEFWVRAAHGAGPALTVRVRDADGAARVLCAAVAALTGADIPAAIARADVAGVAALNPMAHDAIRERLAHLLTDAPRAVEAGLAQRGLG